MLWSKKVEENTIWKHTINIHVSWKKKGHKINVLEKKPHNSTQQPYVDYNNAYSFLTWHVRPLSLTWSSQATNGMPMGALGSTKLSGFATTKIWLPLDIANHLIQVDDLFIDFISTFISKPLIWQSLFLQANPQHQHATWHLTWQVKLSI